MSLRDVTNTLEDLDFSSRVGLANNLQMLKELLQFDRDVRRLLGELANESNARALLSRVEDLIRVQDDVRYRNRRDASVAVYLWALNQTSPALARIAASLVLSAPRLWWARKTALEILGGAEGPSTSNPTRQSTVSSTDWTTSSKAMGESIFIGGTERELVKGERILDPSTVKTHSASAEQELGIENSGPISVDESNSTPTKVMSND
jgi:hypothetical protein